MVAEVRYGVQAIDHIAVPVRDLQRSHQFYEQILGLKLKHTPHDPEAGSRVAYLLAGDNVISLQLSATKACSPAGNASRFGIAVTSARLAEVSARLTAANHPCRGPIEHGDEAPFMRSIYFDDPDGNHLEVCIRRDGLDRECISHTVFETRDLEKAIMFYTESLGTGVPFACESEIFIPVQNRQMIGLAHVPTLSERSRKHGRGFLLAMNVSREDFDSMATLVERYGGKIQGETRAEDGSEEERVLYFFDLDKNRLQISAPGARNADELLPGEQTWQRIAAGLKRNDTSSPVMNRAGRN